MEKIKNSQVYKALLPVILGFLFLFTERSLKGILLFEFSYIAINLHTAVAIFCSWVIIVLFIYKKRKLTDWTAIIGYSVIFICYGISTIINKGSMSRWFDTYIYSIPPIMLIGLAEDKKQLYRILSWIFLAISVLNIAFYFIPSLWSFAFEWHEEFFIGFQNTVGWPLMLGMLFSLLDYKHNGNRVKLTVYIAAFFVNMVIVWCVTAVVGGLIVTAYLILPFVRKWFKNWKFIVFLLITAVLFVFLVFLYERFVNLKPIDEFLRYTIKKDVSLSGRTDVWKTYREAVIQSPVIGYGFADSPAALYVSGVLNNCFIHAHNEWLQTLYEGGIITLAAGLLYVTFVGNKLKSGICKMILFAVLIMLQADMISYYSWYLTALILEVGLIENTQCD